MSRLGILTLILIGSVGSAFILLIKRNEVVSDKNNFVRVFSDQSINHLQTFRLPHESFYFAGVLNDHVYLGDRLHPDKFIKVDHDLLSANYLRLRAHSSDTLIFKRPKLIVTPGFFFLTDGTTRINFYGKLNDLEVNQLDLDSLYFTNIIALSPVSFILRAFDPNKKQYILIKKEMYVNKSYRSYILEKQGEGIYSTEGSINYDPTSSNLAYIYRYRNEYIKLDTNLNVIHTAKTIDTTSIARIDFVRLKDGSISLVAPPFIVNRNSSFWAGYLLIHSALAADNEDRIVFDENSVLDVYSAQVQKYQFSFYVPDFLNEKMIDFAVHKDTLFALYNQHLLSFKLPFLKKGDREEEVHNNLLDPN